LHCDVDFIAPYKHVSVSTHTAVSIHWGFAMWPCTVHSVLNRLFMQPLQESYEIGTLPFLCYKWGNSRSLCILISVFLYFIKQHEIWFSFYYQDLLLRAMRPGSPSPLLYRTPIVIMGWPLGQLWAPLSSLHSSLLMRQMTF
jgi:hypothetical protein